MSGPVVDDESRRLVHHDQVGVLVDHGESHPGIGLWSPVGRGSDGHFQDLARGEGPAADLDALSVHADPAFTHQCGHGTSGQTDEKGHGPVDPFPVEGGGDDGLEFGTGDHFVAHRPPPARTSPWETSMAAAMAPTTMHESATLKVGQK